MSLGHVAASMEISGRPRPGVLRSPEERALDAARNRAQQAAHVLTNETAMLAERQKKLDAAKAVFEQELTVYRAELQKQRDALAAFKAPEGQEEDAKDAARRASKLAQVDAELVRTSPQSDDDLARNAVAIG